MIGTIFRRLILLSVCVVYLLPFVIAQSPVIKEQLLEAESDFLYEEFNEALPIYMKLKDKYPDNIYLDYKIGRCYLNIPFEKQKSLIYLKKASVKITKTNKDGSFKGNEVPVDVIYYLGDAYRINNQLEAAIENYEEFKSKSDKKLYDLKLVDDQILACKRAILMEKKPVVISFHNLGEVINTKYSETHPVVSEDENIMLYATQLPFYQAVFFTKKVNGVWQQPLNIITELGIDDDCIPTCLSSDGTEAYFYRSDQFRGDLYVSNYINGKWTKIRRLNDNVNTKYWESHASLSHDGKTLYFTSNRPGGMGGLDIYMTQRNIGDNWGPPKNLGPVINSSYNEDAPFITSDGKRLYFSSFGHETMGGYDIFYSDKDANGNWTKPVNIGYPLNSTGDDLYFCPVRNGSAGYISKYDSAGFGRFDIVRVEISDYKSQVSNTNAVNTLMPSGNIKNTAQEIPENVNKDKVVREKQLNYNSQNNISSYSDTNINNTNKIRNVTSKAVKDNKVALSNNLNHQTNDLQALKKNTNPGISLNTDKNNEVTDIKPAENISSVTDKKKSGRKFSDVIQDIKWEYYAVPGSLLLFIVLWFALKKRKKRKE